MENVYDVRTSLTKGSFGSDVKPQIQFRIRWFRVILAAWPRNFDFPLTTRKMPELYAKKLATLPYGASELKVLALV